MDNKDQKGLSNFENNKVNFSNDYKFLVQKLKHINEIINLLENKFLQKEK